MPPAEGTELVGSDSLNRKIPLRVATFNIAGGVGKDGKFDLTRTLAAVRGFDVVGVEEVHGSLIGDLGNEIYGLGKESGLPLLFAPTERQWFHESFGNGILCDLRITHWQRFPISTSASHSNRNILLVDAIYFDKPLHIIVTHLDRHEDHDAELRSVISLFNDLSEPAILLGDLNTMESDPQLQSLDSSPGFINCLRSKLGDGIDPINADWIYVRGLRCLNAGFSDNGASDHHLAWADLAPLDESATPAPATRPATIPSQVQ